MSDSNRPDPAAAPHADGDLVAAYLSGDLDDAAARALEGRLPGEPHLARLLDDTARVLVTLRGVDEVAPPAGAGRRLRQRLAAEARGVPGRGPAGADPATGEDHPRPVTELAARRRAVPWQAVAGVAAGLAAFALVGGGLLQGFGDRESAVDVAEEQAPDAGGAVDESARDTAGAESAAEESARQAAPPMAPSATDDETVAAAPQAAVVLPAIVDSEVALSGADDARARYTALPEATGLLGEPLPAAVERAAAYRGEVAAAAAFRSGAHPGGCLDDVGTGSPLLPARVESATLEGRPVLVYVLVGASADATALDRVEAWIVDPAGCVPRLVLDVT